MTENMIDYLVENGGKRWTKGAHDRIYFDAKALGLEYECYKTGRISSAKFRGEEISNNWANKMTEAKTYVDMNTGKVISNEYTLLNALQELVDNYTEHADEDQLTVETSKPAHDEQTAEAEPSFRYSRDEMTSNDLDGFWVNCEFDDATGLSVDVMSRADIETDAAALTEYGMSREEALAYIVARVVEV